jgi:hypothetical protein
VFQFAVTLKALIDILSLSAFRCSCVSFLCE